MNIKSKKLGDIVCVRRKHGGGQRAKVVMVKFRGRAAFNCLTFIEGRC
jgi:hypothetical protein